jgi:hypothetical protein
VSAIRIALLDVTPRLRDIVRAAIAGTTDLELVPYEAGTRVGDGAAPDAVICQVADPLDVETPDRLLRQLPRARLVMVAHTADQAAVYELQPTRRLLLNVSIEELLDTLRTGTDARRSH